MFSHTAFAQLWRNPYVRVLFWGVVLYVLFTTLGQLSSIVLQAGIAYGIAFLFNPMLNWLQARGIGRGFGVLLVLLILLAAIVFAGFVFVAVVQQFISLFTNLPNLVEPAQKWLSGVVTWASETLKRPEIVSVVGNVDTFVQSASSQLTGYAQRLLQGVLSSSQAVVGGVIGVFGSIFNGLLTLILAIYLMSDFSRVGQTLLRLIPRAYQTLALELSQDVGTAIGGWLRGQLLIALFAGVVIGTGLTVIGIPNGLAIGFLAGAFNIIPYVGIWFAIIPAVLLGFTVSPLAAFLVLIIFFVESWIEGNFVGPFIMGRVTNLHPATIILSILASIAAFGVLGAVIGVPLAALVKLLIEHYYIPSRTYRRKLPTSAELEGSEYEPLVSSLILTPPFSHTVESQLEPLEDKSAEGKLGEVTEFRAEGKDRKIVLPPSSEGGR